MRRVRVETPGTCGEYIQGWYDGNPCLVSSPIDRYSRITIAEGPGNLATLKPKTQKQVEAVFRRFAIPQREKEHLHVTMTSDIPLDVTISTGELTRFRPAHTTALATAPVPQARVSPVPRS